jgi:uncharacterized protein (TIGR03086 family)
MNAVADRYRTHADAFERRVAGVRAEQWSHRSPCEDWTARDVVRHIVDMHAAMLRPLERGLSPAPSVDIDPMGAFRSARADIEAVLSDPRLAGTAADTPSGRMTVEQEIDQVVSDDMVIHGWDLARATGQDEVIDPRDVARMWATTTALPTQWLQRLRTPGAIRPNMKVLGPEVQVPADAPLQDHLLGLFGRDAATRRSDAVNRER